MNYAEASTYLEHLGEVRMSLGLENTRSILKAIESPDEHLLTVLVGGTNGKGSTCAFLQSIFIESGLKVGLFTSPHLETPRERIKLGHDLISEEHFAQIASEVKLASEKNKILLTYFEFMTAMAALYFQRQATQICIFEVGLGGRLDSTNALKRLGAILTRIDLDHMHILGDTKGKIALEKVPIFNGATVTVCAKQSDDVEHVIAAYAKQHNIEPLFSRETLPLKTPLGLAGLHQMENAAAAVTFVHALKNHLPWRIQDEEISNGLKNARIEGRLEQWTRKSSPDVWVDIGHNPDAIRQLVRYFQQTSPSKQYTVVIGMLRDKNWKECLRILEPLTKNMLLVKPNSERAWDLSHVEQEVTLPCGAYESIEEGLAQALQMNQEVLALGSFYVAGQIRRLLKNMGYTVSN